MGKLSRRQFIYQSALAGVGTGLAPVLPGCSPQEPSQAFLYDLGDYAKVDPALVKFRETEKITPQMGTVNALATTDAERIYVAGANALAVYDLQGSELNRFEINGTPDCMALAPDGEILLGMRDHVEVIEAGGTLKATWKDMGDRAYITSIAAGDRDVYVADAGNRIVVRFDRQGNELGRIGNKDPDRDIPGFIVPSPYFDLAFDDEGGLWVVNPGRHGLEKYRSNGDLVTSWYNPSMAVEGFCGCCNPLHIAFRKDGSLVTAEKGLARVKIYDPSGTFASLVTEQDSFPSSAADLVACDGGTPIQDIAVDSMDRVLVLDPKEKSVRIFVQKENT